MERAAMAPSYGGAEGVNTPKETDIPSALAELEAAISRLDGGITRLQGRLAKATRVEPTAPDSSKLTRVSSCDLSARIREQIGRLDEIASGVSRQLDCLEL